MPKQPQPDFNPNYATDLPVPIKAMITKYRKAAEEHAFMGSQPPEDHEAIEDSLKVARYNLERSIITHRDKAALRFAKAVSNMFEGDANWSVLDLDGAADFFRMIGFKPSKAARTVEKQ